MSEVLVEEFFKLFDDPAQVANLVESNLSIVKDQECFYHAVMFGVTSLVEVFLDNGADVHQTDRGGLTPLYRAAQEYRFDMVELLLSRGRTRMPKE